jgi:hypothetical protein
MPPRVLALAAGLLLLSCAAPSDREPPEPAVARAVAPDEVPSARGEPRCVERDEDLDVTAECTGALPEGYGTTREQPLEWGPGNASGGTLYFNRLICPSGAAPYVNRTGSVGGAPVASSAPLVLNLPSADILDRWEVHCPTAPPRIWYANMYRCGNPCPPDGFEVLPVVALDALVNTRPMLEQRRYAEALAALEYAIALTPVRFELLEFRRATFLFLSHRYAEALSIYDWLTGVSPANPYYVLYRGMIFNELGDAERYGAALNELLSDLPENHELVPELHCRRGRYLHLVNRHDEADEAERRACELGFARCCE